MKKFYILLTVVALVGSLLAGCGSNGSGGSDLKEIKIATQSPLSGGSATLGEAIKLGAELNLSEQKAAFKELGYSLKLVPYDDQGDPKKGVSNAQTLGADKSIVALVGHLNSGVAIPSSKVYEQYGLAMVSPANTAVDVTERGLKTVNRIVARDDLQGPAGAKYAINELGAKKIFIIQDKTAYGSGLADAFKAAAEKAGAEVVGFEGITVGEKDFNGVLNLVANQKPDALFFAGLYSEGGLIIKQAREKGIDIPILGADGMDSSTLVEIAGDAVKNTYITSVAGDAAASKKGTAFVENYKKKFGKNVESFSVYGYDSMGVVLDGLKRAIKANDGKLPKRDVIAAAIRATKDYQGALTQVSFDSKGDNENAKVFIYKFSEAKYPADMVSEVTK